MGLDYGAKTVGVALSDGLLMTASALTTIRRERESHLRRTLNELCTLCKEHDVGEIILGLPLNMCGSEGERALKTRAFGEALEKRSGLTVTFRDERLTSVEAEGILAGMGIAPEKRAEMTDMTAAKVILQDHLDHLASRRVNEGT